MGTDKWPEGQAVGGLLCSQGSTFGGISFLSILRPKYIKLSLPV